MQNILILFNALICIFEIYMLVDFYGALFEKKTTWKNKQWMIVLFFSTVVWGINALDNTIINLTLVPLIYLLINFIVFTGNIWKKLFATVIAIVVIFGAELISFAVMNLTAEDMVESSLISKSSALVLTVVIKLVTYIAFAVVKKICVKTDRVMDWQTFLTYLLVPVSCLGIMISTVYCGVDFTNSNRAEILLIAFFILLVAGNVAIFYEFNRYATVIKEKEEVKANVIRQKLDLEGYKKLEIANNKYVTLIHDANHYIKNIYSLIANGNIEKAMNVLDAVANVYDASEVIEYSTNTILNTILSDFKSQAEENGIKYDVFVEKGFDIEYVEEIDLVSMISNILKNAFEATVKCETKLIKVQMFMQNDGCFSVIKVLNTYKEEPVLKDDVLITTKGNVEFHGKGIRSINDIASKYYGYLQNSWNDGMFKAVLILENMKL